MWRHFHTKQTLFQELFVFRLFLQVVVLLHTVQYIGLSGAIWISEMRIPAVCEGPQTLNSACVEGG